MRKVLVLICIFSLSANTWGADIADLDSYSWHSTSEGAKIEHLSIDCDGQTLPAIRYTALPYNTLRMPIEPLQNWSGYTHLEFMIKFGQTVGIAYGYLHSDTEKQSWLRKEFSLNRAIGQDGNLTGGVWYKASVPLDPQYYLSWDGSCHDFWVITRLFWNPDQDVEALRRIFLQRTFRAAAMPMARYYAALRQVWFEDTLPSNLGDSPANCMKHYILEKGVEETLHGYLIEAEKLADHPVSKKIIQRHRATFEMYSQEAKDLKAPSASVPLLTTSDFTKAVPVNDFTVMNKRDSRPINKTEMHVFHDAKNLHFRIICHADPDKLHAVKNTTNEEKWPEGDTIELFLSDGKDPNRYYQFAVNCIGNRCDLDNINRMKWDGEW